METLNQASENNSHRQNIPDTFFKFSHNAYMIC